MSPLERRISRRMRPQEKKKKENFSSSRVSKFIYSQMMRVYRTRQLGFVKRSIDVTDR